MIKRPDIYIGLVAAAGTDISQIKSQLRAQLKTVNYEIQEIRVSELIAEHAQLSVKDKPENERIIALMDAGDDIRRSEGAGDAVVPLIVRRIRELRDKGATVTKPKDAIIGNTAFVIDSLKNPKEIVALDNIYARNYYTISVYTPEQQRLNRLKTKIAESNGRPVRGSDVELARSIMAEDENRKPKGLAQNVLDTFPRADFFIRTDTDVAEQLRRLVHLIFGDPFITPTPDEHFMHLARTAALRSCDLSRQVGAIIVDDRKSVVSMGCNEVPFPGGGHFYETLDPKHDNRDYKNARDPNQAEIVSVVADMIGELDKANMLAGPIKGMDYDRAATELLFGKMKDVLNESKIKSLIEFGRVVHAEMHAICEAANKGRSVHDATLYCTTFPCHLCAKHIISSGIKEVVYIEPYPKSHTKKLFEREIHTDDNSISLPNAVVFRPFQGVSPILFRRVFEYKKRKESNGNVITWNGMSALPMRAIQGVFNLDLEDTVAQRSLPNPK